MFIVKRNKAGQQQVIFKESGKVAATYPNRQLCHDFIERNYPEYFEGHPLEIIHKATERAVRALKRAGEPIPPAEQLNATAGFKVWSSRP